MKIRNKLLSALVAASVVVALLAAVLFGNALRRDALARERDRLRGDTAILAASLGRTVVENGPQQLAVDSGRMLGFRIALIGSDGSVLGDSARQADELPSLGNQLDRPEIRAAERDGTGWVVQRSEAPDSELLSVAARVDGQGPVRFVLGALPYDRIRQAADAGRNRLFLTVLAGLLAICAVAYAGARRLSKPVEDITAAAERAALGQPDEARAYDGDDEIGRLAEAIERMKGSLTEKISEIEEERRLLLSVLGGMREGLLLVGPDRRIRLANEAFSQIFGLPFDPAGRLLAEVIRDPTILRDLDAARTEEREVRGSIIETASGRSFELHVTPLPTRSGGGPGDALFLFFDVTRLEALESVRREFVANVSHELRTPLTSIKAFVETLLEARLEDPQNSLKFLEIVRKHADRMGALIDDLTDLSLIETGAVALDLHPVNVGELAQDVAANLEPRSSSLSVEVRVNVPDGFRVRADRMRLEQVLVNLMENAVKFNKPGGQVKVSAQMDDGRPVVVVEDTGVGIPADSAERVFHRFYRVDKARSKNLGGTGLGLSIVKHLMRLHGGQVRLESELGHGSKFFLEFPPDASV